MLGPAVWPGKVYLHRRFLQYVFLQYVFLQKCNFATGIFAITKNTRAKLHCQIQSLVCPQSGAEYSCLKLKTLIYLKSVNHLYFQPQACSFIVYFVIHNCLCLTVFNYTPTPFSSSHISLWIKIIVDVNFNQITMMRIYICKIVLSLICHVFSISNLNLTCLKDQEFLTVLNLPCFDLMIFWCYNKKL